MVKVGRRRNCQVQKSLSPRCFLSSTDFACVCLLCEDPEEEMAALIGGGTAVKGTALQRSALLARPKAFVDKFMFKKPHVVDEVEDEDDQEGEEGEDDEESEVHAYMNQVRCARDSHV